MSAGCTESGGPTHRARGPWGRLQLCLSPDPGPAPQGGGPWGFPGSPKARPSLERVRSSPCRWGRASQHRLTGTACPRAPGGAGPKERAGRLGRPAPPAPQEPTWAGWDPGWKCSRVCHAERGALAQLQAAPAMIPSGWLRHVSKQRPKPSRKWPHGWCRVPEAELPTVLNYSGCIWKFLQSQQVLPAGACRPLARPLPGPKKDLK